MFALSLAATLAAGPVADDVSYVGLPARETPWVSSIADPGRTLRGDWEPPGSVAMVLTRSWPRTATRLAEALALATRVTVLREDDVTARGARRWWRSLSQSARSRVQLTDLLVSSPWIRDYGPFAVRLEQGSRVWVDAGYDRRRVLDESLPSRLSVGRRVQLEDYPDWIEGGAFASNGSGLCVATLEYFDLRGPSLRDGPALAELQRVLGCRVLALVPSLETEPTRHVDMLVQFVSPTRVLVAATEENLDDHVALDDVVGTLLAAAAEHGTRLEIVRVRSRYTDNGGFLSYVNGLFVGSHFLVPEYGEGDEIDRQAARAVASALPGVEIAPVTAEEPARHGGALHCITLGLDEDPAPVRARPGSKYRR